MAGSTTIKGITIEFGGDVTPLQKALRKVKDETKSLDSELKQVNHALKLDPKNVDLLRQKQELLKDKIKLTTQSLDELKRAQKEMDAAGVDKNSEQYRKLQREISNTEQELKKMNGDLKETETAGSKLGRVGAAFQEIGGKITAAGKAFAPYSAAATAALGAMVGLAGKAAGTADDLVTLSKQTGISTDQLQLYAAAADLVDVSVETMAKSQSRLKKTMLTASEGGAVAEYFDQLGVSVTDANGNLRDSNDVFMETIAALGNMENETERDAIAMQIFGKSASELNPLIEDAGKTYSEVSQMLSEHGLSPLSEEELQKANEFQDSLDTIKLIFQQLILQVGTKVAGVLQPILDKVVDKVTAFAEWLSGVDPQIIAIVLGITAAVAAITPVLMAVGIALSAVGAAMSFLAANPVVLIIGAIVALVAAIVLLIKNWDAVKAKALEVWERIKEIFSGVADWFREKFEAAYEAIKGVFSSVAEFFGGIWESIKSRFTDLAVAVGSAISGAVRSGINGVISMIENTINRAIRIINGAIGLINKIPGVSIGTIGELSLPRLAKGGVLYGAQTVIAGEAGPEAIIPLDKLFRQMDRMAETIAGTGGGGVTVNVYATPGMDVTDLAKEIERRIIDSQNRRRLAWQ